MSWLRKSSRRSSTSKAMLHLEALEERTVPTILIQPHWPGVILQPHVAGDQETAPQSVQDNVLRSELVVPIFSGPYWRSHPADQQKLQGQIQTLLGGPYLSGLTQYGSDGKASFYVKTPGAAPCIITDDTPLTLVSGARYPSDANLIGYIKNEMSTHADQVPPTPARPSQAPWYPNWPLYVVINDPADSHAGSISYSPGENTYGDSGQIRAVYIGTKSLPGGALDVDGCTDTFSHELAEATAWDVTVNDPGNYSGDQEDQIADNEPEAGSVADYSARVNGVLVQAYWSGRDRAWIIPDGSPTTTVLRPIWLYNPDPNVAAIDFNGYYSDATTSSPPAGTAKAVVAGRSSTFVLTTGGALWQQTGTGWINLVSKDVTAVDVGVDANGNDAAFVNIKGALLEHTGTDPLTGWTWVWQSGSGAMSASLVQANTVFVNYQGGNLNEHQGLDMNSGWSWIDSGVTAFSAGVDNLGRASVFVTDGTGLWEYNGAGTGYQIDTYNPTALSASQVQANTVFAGYGGDLWEHVGLKLSTGWSYLDTTVTSFSAGVDAAGKATVFVTYTDGTLWEHGGSDPTLGWTQVLVTGATWCRASQFQADSVFVLESTVLMRHTGTVATSNWFVVL